MQATVARTGSGRRMAMSGRFAVRVAHALLLISAAIVPPGVCDACVGRPETGGCRG